MIQLLLLFIINIPGLLVYGQDSEIDEEKICKEHREYLSIKSSNLLTFPAYIEKLFNEKLNLFFIGEFHSNPKNRSIQKELIKFISKRDKDFNCVLFEERIENATEYIKLHKKINIYKDYFNGKNKELANSTFGHQLVSNEDIFILHSYPVSNGARVFYASKKFMNGIFSSNMNLFYHDTASLDKDRDIVMFNNIKNMMTDGTCKKAIIINGAAHISKRYKREINQISLLYEAGYSSKTAIILPATDLNDRSAKDHWAHVCGKIPKIGKMKKTAFLTKQTENGEIVPGQWGWRFRWSDFDSVITP